MDAEINLRLHQHVWDVLVDLAVDETFSEQEKADVQEAMGDLSEMLLDSLSFEVLDAEDSDEGLVLTVKLTVS